MGEFSFTEEEIERYSRHIILDEVGGIGQKKLCEAKVLMIGAGGLGAPALLYLAAAGIGEIGIIDGDNVELSNLQRQIIFSMNDLGKNKATSAKQTIESINPNCKVEATSKHLDINNAREIMKGYDVILDGTDNFPTRFLVADACWLERIPLVSAAVLQFGGQLMTFMPGDGNPCYRCFLPEPPPAGIVPSCQEAGVLGAVLGVMGSLQAMETLNLILGIGKPMTHDLLLYDGFSCEFRKLKRVPDPECSLCGRNATHDSLVEYLHTCSLKQKQE